MKVAVFETQQSNDSGIRGLKELNEFLAGDGTLINVDKIMTAGGGTDSYARHWVTVIYDTLEQAPKDEIPV